MAAAAGPNIVEDGLIFAYDMDNVQKSWKGKPLTNYYGDISTSVPLRWPRTQHFWDGNGWTIDGTFSDPGVQGPRGVFLGLVYKHTSGALSSTWSGNSYGYMLKDISSTNGNTYTMSLWAFVSTDCNITDLKCSTEGATTNPASNGRIGLGHANADNYFHGKMSNVSIYNHALSESEIQQNFQATRSRYGI